MRSRVKVEIDFSMKKKKYIYPNKCILCKNPDKDDIVQRLEDKNGFCLTTEYVQYVCSVKED